VLPGANELVYHRPPTAEREERLGFEERSAADQRDEGELT